MADDREREFVEGVAVLFFHVRGTSTLHECGIACDAANDTEETMRAYLARVRPECELDWAEIKAVPRQ